MKFRTPEEQSDFLEAAALQKLIIAAMREATEKNSQELAALLKQISDRYRSANSYVRSEVTELMQELKNLVGDFEFSSFVHQSVSPIPTRSNSRIIKFALTGCVATAILSVVGFDTIRRLSTITPSLNEVENSTSACTEVNPDRVTIGGYYRRDGTYVKSHEKTMPNHTKADNINCQRK